VRVARIILKVTPRPNLAAHGGEIIYRREEMGQTENRKKDTSFSKGDCRSEKFSRIQGEVANMQKKKKKKG